MGYPLLQMSRHSSHGCFTRSSHGGRSKTTRQSQFFCYGGLHESHHRRSYMYHKVDPKAFSHGSPNAFLHSGHWKTSYRCKAIPVFKPSPVSHGFNEYCHNNCLRNSRVYDKHKNYNPFVFNQTKTMRHLNERLSCYVEKVNFLEQHNESFEKKIAKWYENNAPSMPADRSQYLEEIQKLQNQVQYKQLILLYLFQNKYATIYIFFYFL